MRRVLIATALLIAPLASSRGGRLRTVSINEAADAWQLIPEGDRGAALASLGGVEGFRAKMRKAYNSACERDAMLPAPYRTELRKAIKATAKS